MPTVPAADAAPTVSEVVARALLPHAQRFFALMGNGNAYFTDAVERLGPGVVPVRHEVATVASADAYYRATRELAVASATYGAGYTNTLTALAEARQARIPLVLVVGDQPTTGPRPWDVDQVAASAALGVQTVTVGAEDAGTATVRALRIALGESVPVVLAIPYDLAAVPATAEGARIPVLEVPSPDLPVDAAQVRRIAEALREAKRPLILAGRGARGAEAQLQELARRLHADAATTAPAQGTFHVPDGQRAGFRVLGVCGGFAAPGSAAVMREADVVLVVGAGLNQFTMSFGQSFAGARQVIQVDRSEAATHPAVTDHLRADAASALRAILEEVPGIPEPAEEDGHEQAVEGHGDSAEPALSPGQRPQGHPACREDGEPLAADGRLDPRSLMRRVDAALPPERIISVDGGHFIEWGITYLGVDGPDQVIMVGTQFQSIGLGFPGSAGVNAAAGDRVSVLITGDGGGLMGIADAETYVRTARRGVVLVMNDAAYGAEIHQYGSRGLAEAPMLIPEVDFAGIFQALGARASVVRTLEDLEDFERWAAEGADGVYALDCRISNQVMALHMREVLAQNAKR